MDQMTAYDAIVFPSDDRPPHLVALMTNNISIPLVNPAQPYCCGKMPHPEVHMDYIAEGMGPRAWQHQVSFELPSTTLVFSMMSGANVDHQVVEALDGMNKNFTTPYIIFYPTISRDGMPFPVNKCIREIQGMFYKESMAWRGNIVIAKYRDVDYSAMVDMSMADFPIVKNYLATHQRP